MKLPILIALLAAQTWAMAADNLQDRLTKAKPGQTIKLPAGEFHGPATLPAGVSLKGAGVGKTIIEGGLTISGGNGAQVSDLTLRRAGFVAKDAEGVTVARVRATGAPSGFIFNGVKKGRIENCVSDHNGFGISVSGGADCVVVNCTVSACLELGLSIANCANAVAFNNAIVGSAICLNIDVPEGKHVDYNLYSGMFLGQMKEQTPKRILTAWQYLTGLDAHSVQMPVEFNENFTPKTVLAWAQDRATTAEWGVAEFAGVKAPEKDMLGQARKGRPDVGAVETEAKPSRTPDGSFTVEKDEGIKSAGVFTKNGILISYLFQGLPLPKGKYSFWLPSRDYVNQLIPAGDYEVRLAESDFKWKYLNHIGDNGEDGAQSYTASHNPKFTAFSPKGVVVVQQGLSEDHTGIRAYDVTTGKLRWYIKGGGEAQGVAVGGDGTIYAMVVSNAQKGESRLTRFDGSNGKVIPWPGAKIGHVYPATAPKAKGLAFLGDRLYLAANEANKLFVINTTEGKLEKSLDVPTPAFVSGDEKTKLLWVVSGSSVMAFSPDGAKVAESATVPDPLSVAARDGKIAVASGKTGKIHFLDASDPKNLKPLKEVGRGDGPYGAFAPDRFWFQRHPSRKNEDFLIAGLALGPSDQFSLAEDRRVLVFDGAGKNLWYTIGVFGSQAQPSFSSQNRRYWESPCDLSFMLNEKDGTWQPEGLWDQRSLMPDANGMYYFPIGDFSDGGKSFLVTVSGQFGKDAKKEPLPILTVARLENFKSTPVLMVFDEAGKAVSREDTNGDGKITKEDTGQPLVLADGKPFPVNLFYRCYLQPDGSILNTGLEGLLLWKRTGLNAKGVPVYDGKNYASIMEKDWTKALSPYDFKSEYANMRAHGGPGGGCGFAAGGFLSDGGFVTKPSVRGSGGTGLCAVAGTDLVGYGADGRLRWIHQLAQHKGIAGFGVADDITLTSVFYSCETISVDADGLSLGGFCEPAQLGYVGYWIDHQNLCLFKLPDGKLHATWGDNCNGRHPWFRLENQESLKRTKHPFQLADTRAKELAAMEPGSTTTATVQIPPPQIRIPQLKAPLPIDGSLEKWRAAGVRPQIVIGPSGAFDGPGDCSAVIRMAYEGQNIYFQILEFDDVPMFYQMINQDTVELAINGACGPGYQFICYKNAEGKDIVWRNRFFAGNTQKEFDPQHTPRIVKVLDHAADVPERQELEGLYGVDLSKAKVVVTEFKLPIDKETFGGDVFPLAPGKTFTVGFFVDDNDNPYTDVQSLISWPPTFSMFSPKEDGALAICE